jgi:hypothetical protein
MTLLFQYDEDTANQIPVHAIIRRPVHDFVHARCLRLGPNKRNSFSRFPFINGFFVLILPKILRVNQASCVC